MLITTRDNIKDLIGVTSSDDNIIIASIALAVSAAIESYLMRKIELVERTEYYDVNDGQTMFFVNAYPITTIAIYNDYARTFSTAISSDNYSILGNSGRIVVDKQSLTSGYNALKVVYTGGLAASQSALQSSYPDIEMAARIQGGLWYNARKRLGLSSESIQGGGQTTYKKLTLDPTVKESLETYRNKEYV